MKKLKRTKSLLAFLLALCICAILPTATVLAEDENDSVDVMDSPGGGSITVDTTVRNNFTDFNVTDDINLTIGEDYIIDFTKEDILSYALRSMVDLEKTKYYQFANSDKNSLIETEDISDAFLKIVGNKAENRAVMTLMDEANAGASLSIAIYAYQIYGYYIDESWR